MELALIILRLFLATIFVVAAASKLSDREGTRNAVAAFGVPTGLIAFAGIALPIVELLVAAMLIPAVTSWYGAVGAVVLLGAFTIAIIVQLIKGNTPDCHCFGQISSGSIGYSTVFRNLVLITPAIVLVYRGVAGQGKEVTQLGQNDVQLILVLTVVLLLCLAIDLLRKVLTKQSELDLKLDVIAISSVEPTAVERENAGDPHDGMPIGAILPVHELKDTDNAVVLTNELLQDGRGALLLFVSASCSPCKAMVPKFREWTSELTEKTNVYLISSGSADENIKKFGDTPSMPLLLQNGRAFANEIGAKWTPSAIYINANGRVASHLAAGDGAISQLVEDLIAGDLSDQFASFAVATGSGVSKFEVGSELPAFSASSIDGVEITADSIRGTDTVLAFWSTSCSHCTAMLADLKAWERRKNGDGPNLILFSDGDESELRELGIESPIIHDPGHKRAATLGMFGTPSAVLVNGDGKYVSEIAVGASNIWAVVGKK